MNYKHIASLVVVLFALVVGIGCTTQPASTGERTIEVSAGSGPAFTTQTINGVSWAVPKGMDLERYPIISRRPNRKLTESEVMGMRLRLSMVPAGTVLHNEDPTHHAFWLDTMRKERKVWVNEAGEVVYIEDCGNRAMVPIPYPICPANVVCAGPHLATTATTGDGTSGNNNTQGASSGYRISEWIRSLWNGLLNLLMLLAILALIAVLLALAYLLGRELYQVIRYGWGAPRQPQPVVPAVPVRPRHFGPHPVVAGPAPAPPPPPIPAATFQRYGPYDHIAIDNAGAQGYRVTGYTGDQETPLGVFQWAETENAGDRGEYVIVMI